MILKDKVAIITGATGGIGKETVKLFIKEGAKVTLVDLNQEDLDLLVKELQLSDDQYITASADVSNEEDVKVFVKETVNAFGKIDILFNNAGTEGRFSLIKDCPSENLSTVLNVNVNGVFYGIKHVMPYMINQNHGVILNNASVAGFSGSAGLAPYVASKHAVLGLTKTAALEGAEFGIRVVAICPGPINNRMMRSIEEGAAPGHGDVVKQQFEQMIPLKRYGESEEVAQLALFLASDMASYITGSSYAIDGGLLAN